MKAKLVLLHWKDAVTPTQGWTDINELQTELAECVSVGFVVEENDQTITTNYTIGNGSAKNASSVGDLAINSGVTVTVPANARWVIL